MQIQEVVTQLLNKRTCTKQQLQSILGLLLYVHKCVRPAHIFLNRMLKLLRASHVSQMIVLTPDFDLRWFAKFLAQSNGVNLYDHVATHQTLELDACLTGLGGRVENYVYHLPIEKGYENCNIVHLEMVNILVAIRLFTKQWAGRKILVKCDNQAVVTVLSSGQNTRSVLVCLCKKHLVLRSCI